MRPTFTVTGCILLTGIIVFLSCKKEYSCEGCRGDNKPPIANAGPDQVITLPTDSVSLDGSASSDPDGMISSFLWTKISGLASFTITKASDSITMVKALVAGIYQFELKVTDAGGLFAKDTMQVIVNPTSVKGCNTTMNVVDHLPTAGMVGYAVSAGSKILFTRPGSNHIVDIYDTLTHSWQTVSGMIAAGVYSASGYPQSSQAAVVNNKAIFYAAEMTTDGRPLNQMINIYDASSSSWSVNHFPDRGRWFYGSTVVDNKVIYAGGEGVDSNISKTIDIFDATSNSWSIMNFNDGRRGMTVNSIGNKVVFAGGYITRYDSIIQVCGDYGNNCTNVPAVAPVNRIDIWDMASNTWSVAQLSEARCLMVTAVVGNKIIFAGGDKLDGAAHSNQIDIYDAANNSWSSHSVPFSSWYGPVLAYTAGNKVLICNWISDRIDIYDAVSNSWSVVHMPEPLIGEAHQYGQVAISGNKIVFYLQYVTDEGGSKNIDIYDASTNTWCHTQLNQPMVRQGIVTCGNSVYVAGGFSMTGCCTFNTLMDTVWKLKF